MLAIMPAIGVLRFTEDDPRALEFFDPLTNIARHYELTSVLVMPGEANEQPMPAGPVLGAAHDEKRAPVRRHRGRMQDTDEVAAPAVEDAGSLVHPRAPEAVAIRPPSR